LERCSKSGGAVEQNEDNAVVLGGVSTSNGVEATARSPFDLGYNIVFVLDATADPDAESIGTAKHHQRLDSIQQTARKHGLTVAELEDWKERFLPAADNALRAKPASGMPRHSASREGSVGDVRLLGAREASAASVTGARAVRFTRKCFKGAAQIRSAARAAPPADWEGFSLFYPMPEKETRSSSGYDLVRGSLGAFGEVTPAMNLCMQAPLSLAADGRLLQEKARR